MEELHGMGLSEREIEVLQYYADDGRTRDVQTKLWISTHTTKTHLAKIKLKLGVETTWGAIAKGFRLGLIK